MFQHKQFNNVGLTVFALCLAGGLAGARLTGSGLFAMAGAFVGVYFLFAIKVVDQWQKAALLRFGRYRGLRGPGLFLIIPIIETLSRYVDQRVRVTTVSAESTLTRDTVPVNVDAIIFWLVASRCRISEKWHMQSVSNPPRPTSERSSIRRPCRD